MSTQITVQEQKKQDMVTVQKTLEAMKGQLSMALPDHIKPERMIRVALTAIQNTPKLLECDRGSFYLAVLRAAQLGLEPDGIMGQAYLVPYGKQVQLIPGYKGLIDLARRSGEVSNIIAREVCKNDEFTVDWSREIPFEHKPKLDGDRGEITHFWAMARFKDGGFHWDYMTKDDVIAIRNGSSGWQSAVKYAKRDQDGNIIEIKSPWEQNFVEMGKKTAIRRIAKFLPMSVQRAAIVEDMIDAGKKFTADQFGEIIVENDDKLIEGDVSSSFKLDNFANEPDEAPKAPNPSKIEERPVLSENPTQKEAETYAKMLIAKLETVAPDVRMSLLNVWDGERLLQILSQKGLGMTSEKITKLIPELKN